MCNLGKGDGPEARVLCGEEPLQFRAGPRIQTVGPLPSSTLPSFPDFVVGSCLQTSLAPLLAFTGPCDLDSHSPNPASPSSQCPACLVSQPPDTLGCSFLEHPPHPSHWAHLPSLIGLSLSPTSSVSLK